MVSARGRRTPRHGGSHVSMAQLGWRRGKGVLACDVRLNRLGMDPADPSLDGAPAGRPRPPRGEGLLPDADAGPDDPGADSRMRAIYDAYAVPLHRFLLRLMLGDWLAAEDLLQDTLLRAWRNLDRLPADPTELRPWLFTVARNLAIDLLRARQVRPAEVGMNSMSWVPAIGDDVERSLAAATVRRALLELSPEHRAVLVELYYRDASAAEAAARLGIPEGTVKSRAHYALRALRSAIGSIEE